MVNTSPEGSSTMVIEVDANQNSRTVSTSNGTEIAAFVYLNKTTYVKDYTDGAWTKFTTTDSTEDTNPSDELDFTFDNEPSDAAANKTEYKSLGKEACGSLNCFKYQIIDPAAPGDESIVWFDDKDYKLRRYSFKNAEGSTDMTYSYESVTITEPSPIKEMPTGMDAATQAQVEEALRVYENLQ